MAEESILLKVGIDENQIARSEAAIISARKSIDDLKEANKELAAEGKKNTAEFIRNETAIRELNTTVRENQRVLDANAKLQKGVGGSIRELRANVSRLKEEYVNLSEEERNNAKVGGALQKELLAQTETLKKLEAEIGVTSRNVGNYTASILEAADGSGLFSKAQAALAAAQKVANAATQGGTIATQSFGKALLASGVGAFVVLLGSLISYLTRTQEGMDKVAQVTEAVGTFVAVVFDEFSRLGKQLISAVIPTFEGLGEILAGIFTLDFDRVKNGFAAVGDAVSQIEGINVLEVGVNAAKAAKEAAGLEKQLQNVVRAEKALELERAQSRQQIEDLKKASDDITKSTQERAAAAEKALAIELGLEQKAIDLQKERIEVLKAKNALSNSTDADINKVIDAEIELANLQQESATKQIELNNKLNALNKEAADAGKKALEDNTKLFEADLKNRQKAAEISAKASIEGLKKQFIDGLISYKDYQDGLNDVEFTALAVRKSALEAELERVKASDSIESERKKQLLIDLNNELLGINSEYLSAEFESRRQQLEKIKELNAKNAEARAFAIDLEFNQRDQRIAEGLEAEALTEAEAAKLRAQNSLDRLNADKLALQQRLEAIKANIALEEGERVSAERDIALKVIEINTKLAEEKKKLAEDTANAQISAENAVLSAAKAVFGEQSAAGKLAASFQAILDTYRSANLALATVPPPFGQIIAAANVATGLANVAKINSRSAPKFAEGGGIEVSGPSHASGGVDVALGGQTVANVEGGEGIFVMKKSAYSALKALSSFNEAHGGRSWFGGGKRFLADGGAVARSSAPSLDRRALLDSQQTFSRALESVNIIARISDINRAQNEAKVISVSGDLG